MGTEEELESVEQEVPVLTDQEVFDEAEAPEKPETEEVEAQPEEEPKAERERDEKGRFKPKEEEAQEEHVDHRIPLRELLDEREKRQQIQAQFEAMQQQMAQRQAWEQQQAQAQQAEQQMVDIFEHPDWYQQQFMQMPQMIQQQVNQRLAMMEWKLRGDYSLDRVRNSDPEGFDEAWQELERRTYGGDGSWRQQMLTSPDPGGTLMSLYKRETVTQRVGDDPDAFLQNALEEKLNDPEFLAQALERARDMAKAQPTRKVSTPSINKAGGVSGGRSAGSMDDAALWEETMR